MGMQNICPSNIAPPFENFGENFKGGPQCTSVTPKLLAHVGSKISKVEGEGGGGTTNYVTDTPLPVSSRAREKPSVAGVFQRPNRYFRSP